MDGVTVSGAPAGMTVEATGSNAGASKTSFAAAGFIASANSAEVTDGHVKNLAHVSADMKDGAAGGFVGISRTGDLADVSDETSIGGYPGLETPWWAWRTWSMRWAIWCPPTPERRRELHQWRRRRGRCRRRLCGRLPKRKGREWPNSPWAVYNIAQVTGGSYASGSGGKVTSGALAEAGGA